MYEIVGRDIVAEGKILILNVPEAIAASLVSRLNQKNKHKKTHLQPTKA